VDVFISWSGDETREIALQLRSWLKSVIQTVNPWVSKADLETGLKWGAELSDKLDSTSYGIVLLTKDNLMAPWLNFEAGALSKRVSEKTHVVPLFIDLDPVQVTTPLQQFQGLPFNEEGMRQLVHAINFAMGMPLEKPNLDEAFDTWWPKLNDWFENYKVTARTAPTALAKRSVEDMIEELLTLTRDMARRDVSVTGMPAVIRTTRLQSVGAMFSGEGTLGVSGKALPDREVRVKNFINEVIDDAASLVPTLRQHLGGLKIDWANDIATYDIEGLTPYDIIALQGWTRGNDFGVLVSDTRMHIALPDQFED
jgi:hypothetical protein